MTTSRQDPDGRATGRPTDGPFVDPALMTEVVALVDQAWAVRSPAERSVLDQRMEAFSGATTSPDLSDLELVRQRGALSGAVAPADLVRELDGDAGAQALDVLAPDFDRSCVDGTWTWTMREKPGAACSTWSPKSPCPSPSTTSRPSAPISRASSSETWPHRRRGTAGRRCRGTSRARGRRSRRCGGVPHSADSEASWPKPSRMARLTALRDAYATLSPRGVFGRERELEKLRAFAEDTVVGPDIPFLSVVGIGGSGKSTLLGSLIAPYLERIAARDPECPAVVVIDFDRQVFKPDFEVELSFELTRQLGDAAPVAGADFSVLRHQTREARGPGVAPSCHSAAAPTKRAPARRRASRPRPTCSSASARLNDRPVLLVLDTFEEWQRVRPVAYLPRESYNEPEDRLFEWIWSLRGQLGLRQLRVVASGRAPIRDLGFGQVLQPIELGDLRRSAAAQLLLSEGVDRDALEPLIQLVGGNPLSLRVGARFFTGLEPRARARFLATPKAGSDELDAELRRALLYDRYLDHLGEKGLRPLAHPGLVLRRVTPT